MSDYKRLIAVGLTATMIMGSPVVAFAADKEASSSGEGETQFVETSDVFDVVFPTVAENATTFDYLLDPNGLIEKTSGDRYTGKQFDAGKTVYFLRSEQVDGTIGTGDSAADGKCDYTDSSDEIKIVNKSTQAVDLKVTAKVTDVPEGIKMATAAAMTGTETQLYLALKGTDGKADSTPTEKAITADGIDLTATINADDAAYEVKWDATANAYVKSLTDDAKDADYAGFESYSFQLTGACNTTEGTDWSGLTDKAPKIDLTWSVKDFTVTGPQVSVDSNGLVTMSGLTAEKNFKVAYITLSTGTYDISGSPVTWIGDGDTWSAANGGTLKIQLGEAWMNALNGEDDASIAVTLSDNSTITSSINL